MKAGRLWRLPSGSLAVLAVAAGLTGPATGAWAAADEPTAADSKTEKTAAAQPAAAAAKKPVSAKLDFIDEMIQEAWDQASVKPSKQCTDEEFLRRAYLDVIGRIPNVEEASAFLGSKEAGKRAKLVSYLLEQPDFAKNFATQWTIMLIGRGRQERGVERNELASWIRRQFKDERAWNEMVYDLITAKGSSKENGATNFALSHLEFGAVPLTSITTRVFLGQQIQCTQCHDHPSNDWKQADFWGINAFYKGVHKEEVMKEDATGKEVLDHLMLYDEPTESYASFDKRNGLVGIAFPKFLDGRKISQGPDVDRREALGKFVADPKNMDLARAFVNRMWGHFLGRGIVHPVDDFGAHNPPSHPELLDKLAEEFQASGYNIKAVVRWITASQAYNLSSAMTKANEKDETLFSHMALKPMTPEQMFDSLITATSAHKASGGDTSKKRDEWMKQFVITFANDEGEEGSNFQGTIPQALMMMNGDLIDQATNGKSGSFLADTTVQALRHQAPETYMVNHLYIAALSRVPSQNERLATVKVLSSNPDTLAVLQDVFWALLNSNEFVLNH